MRMLQKIHTNHHAKSILICIHDILNDCQSDWSREIAKNLSDYMVNRFLKYGYDVCIGTDENELLSHGLDQYSHAVVIASGTSPKLSDRLIGAIEAKCNEDFYLAGHVLDRKEKYFELHHQFYIVNLKTHVELGCPIIGDSSDNTYTLTKPISDTNDDYIAQVLSTGTEECTYYGVMHGWNILSKALEHNKTIIDLGNDIRNNKKYFYYEYDHVFLKESTSLYYNQYFFNNFVVPFNSDRISENLVFEGPIEQYITLGTGINWVENLHKVGFTESTVVYFTDINPLVLQFMQSMVKEWDGEDYVDFYMSKNFIIPNNMAYDYNSYMEQTRNQWVTFRANNPDWLTKWNNIRTLAFKFISIDYMSEYNFDWFDSNKKTIFNASDMFDHVPVVFQQSMKYRIAAENRFITRLQEKDPNIHLLWTSRACTELMNTSDSPKFQPISEVNVVDIEQIVRPYWHKDDWNTLRPLL